MLRVAINLGNPNLATQTSTGEAVGLSVDLATELSRLLSIPLTFVTYSGAGQVFEAADSDVWDMAFLAIDPLREGAMVFTAPYVILSG